MKLGEVIMKKATGILLIAILFLSLSLNLYFVVSFVLGDGKPEGLKIGKNEYAGHWTSQEYMPDIYIENDGTVYAVSIADKRATEADPYSQYISLLYVGYCENDNVVITKYAKIYDPNVIHISEDGSSGAYYFHSIEEVTEEYYADTAQVWTITSITDDAIEIEGFYPAKATYIRKED